MRKYMLTANIEQAHQGMDVLTLLVRFFEC